MSGLRSWNFWTPIYGTLYAYRSYHPGDFLLMLEGHPVRPRTIYAYGGKTTRRDWEARLEEHMWGGGPYGATADPWADTVLGWSPDGTVDDIMAAGGYYNIWQGWTVPLFLSIGEVLIAIKLRRPYYNYQWNQTNPRRIPIYEQESQRELRDLARGPGSGIPARRALSRAKSRTRRTVGHRVLMASPMARQVSAVPRLLGYYRRWLLLAVLLGLGVLCLPGMPVALAIAAVLGWIGAHRDELIAMGVLTAGLLFVMPRMRKTRTRKRRSPRRRQSRSRRR